MHNGALRHPNGVAEHLTERLLGHPRTTKPEAAKAEEQGGDKEEKSDDAVAKVEVEVEVGPQSNGSEKDGISAKDFVSADIIK